MQMEQTHAALVTQRPLFGLGLRLSVHDRKPFRQLEPRVVNQMVSWALRPEKTAFLESKVVAVH